MARKIASYIKRIVSGLKDYYSEPLVDSFRQFRNGLIYFSVGLVIIYLANTTLPASLKQELVTAAGIFLVAVGFFIAMMAQIKMLISRIVMFFRKK